MKRDTYTIANEPPPTPHQETPVVSTGLRRIVIGCAVGTLIIAALLIKAALG